MSIVDCALLQLHDLARSALLCGCLVAARARSGMLFSRFNELFFEKLLGEVDGWVLVKCLMDWRNVRFSDRLSKFLFRFLFNLYFYWLNLTLLD